LKALTASVLKSSLDKAIHWGLPKLKEKIDWLRLFDDFCDVQQNFRRLTTANKNGPRQIGNATTTMPVFAQAGKGLP
jgi:hypothetical protein